MQEPPLPLFFIGPLPSKDTPIITSDFRHTKLVKYISPLTIRAHRPFSNISPLIIRVHRPFSNISPLIIRVHRPFSNEKVAL